MKICIASDAWNPQVNGVVHTLSRTKEYLESRGFEVLMITPNLFKTFPCPTYPEIRLSIFPKSKIEVLLNKFRPDCVHIATEGPIGLAMRNLLVHKGMTFTTSFHTRFPEYIKKRTKLPLSVGYSYLRWFHKKAHKVLTPTKNIIDELKVWGIYNTTIWSRGVDTSMFKPLNLRKNIPSKKPILINVGRVAVEKNLEAFLNLDIDCEKWIVGDGPDLSKLKRKYNNVKFFGHKNQNQLPFIYQKADVFVFPSKTDTFGLVLLEAMACGLPVAAYPVAAPKNVVGKSGAGVLDRNLKNAVKEALKIPRKIPSNYAKKFRWDNVGKTFLSNLQNTRRSKPGSYVVSDNPHKKNKGLRRLFLAFRNSLSGFKFAFDEESAFRQELLLSLILIPTALFSSATTLEKIAMIGSVFFLLTIELLNSSVEAAIDRISFEKHDLSKRAKDLGSAAVFVALVFVFITYTFILFPESMQ